MKNFLLIAIFIGLCIAYYFDKYHKPSDDILNENETSLFTNITNKSDKNSKSAKAIELPTKEITKKAKELFPTKIADRNTWIAEQEKAFNYIVNTTNKLPPEIANAILKDALSKYGLFYSKQLNYVKKQTVACKNCIVALKKTPLKDEQISNILKQLEKDFGADYDIQLRAIDKIVFAYDMIASKSINLPAEILANISTKVMPIIIKDPDTAAVMFQEQALAYHNYSTKKIPDVYGNLKEGIEKMFPNDYIAQLNELNLRLDTALTQRNFVPWKNGEQEKQLQTYSAISKEYFDKYIYNFEAGGNNYLAYFIDINNVKALFFPAQALEFIKGNFSLDIGNEEQITASKLYITKNTNLALIVPNKSNECTSLDIIPQAELKDKEFDVEIVGLDTDFKPIIAYTKVKNNVIIDSGFFKDLKSRNANGSLVIDKQSKRVIGFLEEIPQNAYQYYARFGDPDIDALLKEKSRLRLWDGLAKIISFAENTSTKTTNKKYRIVSIDELRNAEGFDMRKFDIEKTNVDKLCIANYALMSFMFMGNYGQDLETELISTVSNKYTNVFVKGPRMQKTTLANTFGRYTRDIKQSIAATVNFAKSENFYKNYYYSLNEVAKNQAELNNMLNTIMNNQLIGLDYYDIIHQDIMAQIDGETFVPFEAKPAKPSVKASIDGGGGGLIIRMRN